MPRPPRLERFVAEHYHELPPVDHLVEILDRYDELRSAVQGPRDDEVTLEERELFQLEWVSFREHLLRGALEEVAWQLEQRGHHVWIDDIGAQEAGDWIDTGTNEIPAARPLAFRVAAGDQPFDAAGAAELRFQPDVGQCRVHVDAHFGDPRTTDLLRIAPGVRIDVLRERLVIDIATEFVREVLFANLRPGVAADLESVEEPLDEEPPVPTIREHAEGDQEQERQWSETGIMSRWLDQQRARRAQKDVHDHQ